jgi:hypothetical protein
MTPRERKRGTESTGMALCLPLTPYKKMGKIKTESTSMALCLALALAV